MITTGCVRGKQIELDEPLNLPSGTRVEVLVRPLLEKDSASIIGMFADEPELLDAIVQEIMSQRESRPLRAREEIDE